MKGMSKIEIFWKRAANIKASSFDNNHGLMVSFIESDTKEQVKSQCVTERTAEV
jgi:hypothetical protein